MYAFKKWSHLRFYFSGMWHIIVPSAVLSIWATHAFRSRLVRIPPLLSSPSHLRLSDTLFLLLSALRGASCTPVVAGAFRIASLFTSLPPEGSRLLQGQDLASSISLSSIEVFFLKKKKKNVFTWLHRVLVAARRIFSLCCIMQNPQWQHTASLASA